MVDVESEINELFAPHGSSLPQDVFNEILSITNLLSLSAQELFYKWESYVLKMGYETTKLEYKTVKDFRKDLQDALERESRAKGHGMHNAGRKTVTATPRAGAGGDVFGMLDGLVSGTPMRGSASTKRKAGNMQTPATKAVKNGLNSSPTPAPARDSTAVSFQNRPNIGKIEEQLNPHLPAAVAPSESPTEPRVKLKANTDLPKYAYKPMAMQLTSASELLDERIDSFTELVLEEHKLPASAFGNPAAQSTAEIVAVGRIACDQLNGKLNAASLVLETSRRMGAGMRVPLRLPQTLSYDFFPGKIVALRGTNVSGEYFAVTEILPLPLITPAASTPAEVDILNDRLSGPDGESRPLSWLIASGPYTPDTDLSFSALHALLSRAADDKTDVIILTGPFLDLEHPLLASGDLEPHLPPNTKLDPDRATLTDVFRALIIAPIQQLVHSHPAVTLILVPSVRDAISKHVSWPQDRFPRTGLNLPRQVQIVTNPITLSINEVVVGISSQDVLSELRRDNVYQSGAKSGAAFNDDFLSRMSSHVIEQQHFFPVFPPQAQENLLKPTPVPGEIFSTEGGVEQQDGRLPVGANLDVAYMKLGEWLLRPDVLILPSMLSPFARVINSVLCINPGTLSKRRGAGTFAALNILPRKLTEEERGEERVGNAVFERARVDVMRI